MVFLLDETHESVNNKFNNAGLQRDRPHRVLTTSYNYLGGSEPFSNPEQCWSSISAIKYETHFRGTVGHKTQYAAIIDSKRGHNILQSLKASSPTLFYSYYTSPATMPPTLPTNITKLLLNIALIFFLFPIAGSCKKPRAGVPIENQDGCTVFCHYCTTPNSTVPYIHLPYT